MLKFIPFLLFLISPLLLASQEICDNGVDDDGDLLIDLNDPDCICSILPEVPSFLPNPSFEEYENDDDCNSAFPSGSPDEINQANCLASWLQVSNGTTDSWNANTFFGAYSNFPDSIPLPMPDGFGAVGFWVGISVSIEDRYREYIGSCIESTPLLADNEYRLEFDLGFIQPEDQGSILTSSPGPVELALYGVTDCNNLFFNGATCPEEAGAPGYILLDLVSVDGTPGNWTNAAFEFSPFEDIVGIAIGGSCSDDIVVDPTFFDYGNYYLLDDLVLNRLESFDDFVIGDLEASGSACDSNLILSASSFPNASYQWYESGIAISGETDNTYAVPPGSAGEFQVRVDFGDSCGVSPSYLVAFPEILIDFPDTTSICNGSIVSFPVPGAPGLDYLFEFPDTTYSSSTFMTITTTGWHFFTAINDCVTVRDSFFVVSDGLPLDITATPSATSGCPGTQITIQADAPNAFFFTWTDASGNILTSNISPFFDFTLTQDTSIIVQATDFSCGFGEFTLDFTVEEQPQPISTVTPTDCNGLGGSIALTFPNQNTSNYEIIWEDDLGNTLGDNSTLNDLSSGVYFLSILNGGGCSFDTTFVVEQPLGFNLTTDGISPTCNGQEDGAIFSSITNGTAPFSYSWFDNSGNFIGSDPEILDLPAGSYQLLVSDAEGCTNEGSVILTDPEPVSFTLSTNNPDCTDPASGQISLSASGGTAPYFFSLNGAPYEQINQFDNLLAGTYTVEILDDQACDAPLQNATLVDPIPITVDIAGNTSIILGESVNLSAITNATNPALISWTPATDLSCNDCLFPTATPLENTTYTLTIQSLENCVAQDSITIQVEEESFIAVPNAFSPNGDGFNDRLEVFTGASVVGILNMQIFNRWGGLIYEGNSFWDGFVNGEEASMGTYVYLIEAELFSGEIIKLQGDVTLLR